MNTQQTRRQFIRNSGYLVLGVSLFGCGVTEESDGSSDNDDNSNTNNTVLESEAPVWSRIPLQSWIVGVPVYIDLADYAVDPEGSELTFLIDKSLPDGVTLNGSIISGTPVATYDQATYVATADDGTN